MFFIYPPFIWGLVELYSEGRAQIHVVSLLVNVILLLVIGLVVSLLITNGNLHFPTKKEQKYLIFGFSGNVIMYFYTFQNMMNIDDIVTIYLALLLVLVVHYLLISRTVVLKELWILLTLFILLDYSHLLISGHGFTEWHRSNLSGGYWPLTLIYSIAALSILFYYIYRLLTYKLYDFFKVVNIALVISLSMLFQLNNPDEKLLGTLAILTPFFVIVDFIVKIINKSYTHKMLLFYIRTTVILIVFGVLGSMNFFEGAANVYILSIMVTATYVSLGIAILRTLLKIDVEVDNPLLIKEQISKNERFLKATPELDHRINDAFDITIKEMDIYNKSTLSYVLEKDDDIKAFIILKKKKNTEFEYTEAIMDNFFIKTSDEKLTKTFFENLVSELRKETIDQLRLITSDEALINVLINKQFNVTKLEEDYLVFKVL